MALHNSFLCVLRINSITSCSSNKNMATSFAFITAPNMFLKWQALFRLAPFRSGFHWFQRAYINIGQFWLQGDLDGSYCIIWLMAPYGTNIHNLSNTSRCRFAPIRKFTLFGFSIMGEKEVWRGLFNRLDRGKICLFFTLYRNSSCQWVHSGTAHVPRDW